MTPRLPPEGLQRPAAGPPPATLDLAARTRSGMVVVLALAGLAAVGNGGWMVLDGRPVDAVGRSLLLGVACLFGAVFVRRGGRVDLVCNGLLTLVMVAVLTSTWTRGLTSTMLPLLVIASPVATATVGRRAGRFW